MIPASHVPLDSEADSFILVGLGAIAVGQAELSIIVCLAAIDVDRRGLSVDAGWQCSIMNAEDILKKGLERTSRNRGLKRHGRGIYAAEKPPVLYVVMGKSW